MAQFIDIEFLVLGTKQVFPEGWRAIGLNVDYTQDFASVELTVQDLTFAGEDKILIEEIKNDIGLQASIPITIQVDAFQEEFVLSPKKNYIKETDYITIGIQRRYGMDRLLKRASSLTWDEVDRRSPITGATLIPYRVIDPNRAPLIISLFIQEALLLLSLYDKVRGFANAAASILGGITGAIESAAIVVNEIVHTAVMVATWVVTTIRLFEQLYPPQKTLYENKLYNLIRLGVESMGYTLISNLLSSYGNIGIVGVPLRDNNPSLLDNLINNTTFKNEKYPTALDKTIATVGDAIDAVKTMFAAKMQVIGNTVIIENDEYFQNQPTQNIETNLTNQEEYTDSNGYNFGDSWAHKYIGYQTDISDRYTLDQIQGMRAEYRTMYTGTGTGDLFEIEGSQRVDIPFSLAKRKNSLSAFDQIALSVAVVIDSVINSFGGNSNLSGQITGSIGEMIISDPHFEKTKLVYTVGGKQPANFLDKISARAIYEKNHTHLQVKENFKAIFESQIRFSAFNFQQIINQYYVNDQFNNKLQLLDLTWITGDSEMTLNYGINEPQESKTETIRTHG